MPPHFVQNDITTMKMDAIVNAAMRGGWAKKGDGAIHRIVGMVLLAECRTESGGEYHRRSATGLLHDSVSGIFIPSAKRSLPMCLRQVY